MLTTTHASTLWLQTPCTAFEGQKRIATGELREVARAVKPVVDREDRPLVIIFEDLTSHVIDVDFRGSEDAVMARLEERAAQMPAPVLEDETRTPSGPGRPKLGVIAREVTLLPRHWEWLNAQPGGASVALRKLVEEARKANAGKDLIRQTKESAYRFMYAMGGNLDWFEEASRALFAGNRASLEELTATWPTDVRDHLLKISAGAFTA